MTKEYKRTQRIESVMKNTLSVLIRNRYEQWRDRIISITRIKISPDLSYAKVYISLFSDHDPQPLVHFLNQEAKTLRYLLAQEMKLRKMPEFHFYFDDSVQNSEHMMELLTDVEESLDQEKSL